MIWIVQWQRMFKSHQKVDYLMKMETFAWFLMNINLLEVTLLTTREVQTHIAEMHFFLFLQILTWEIKILVMPVITTS